jgi:hypothetical protein
MVTLQIPITDRYRTCIEYEVVHFKESPTIFQVVEHFSKISNEFVEIGDNVSAYYATFAILSVGLVPSENWKTVTKDGPTHDKAEIMLYIGQIVPQYCDIIWDYVD